jgi:A/G-specific adenine glycosylase
MVREKEADFNIQVLLEGYPIQIFQDRLLTWYRENLRTLPWRQTKDPYKIWVSEIMLQQTQVVTVIDYYERFLKQFPDIKALARAEEEHVLKAWEGLGYYSRARNLHKAAKKVVSEYGGVFPKKSKELLDVPGIGSYTAGAIASIAYGEPVPAVDGNVMRVFARIFNWHEDILKPKVKKLMEEIGINVIAHDDPSSFNQGLMEIGALICTPTNPKCGNCPLNEICRAKDAGVAEQLPIKTKKGQKKTVLLEVGYVTFEDKVLVVKRPKTGLLARLWAFPSIEKNENKVVGYTLLEMLVAHDYIERVGQLNIHPTLLREKEHIFTNLKWKMCFYEIACKGVDSKKKDLIESKLRNQNLEFRWVTEVELKKLVMPVAFKKLLD